MICEEKTKLLIKFMSMHESDRKQINNLMERLDRFMESQFSSPDYKTLFEDAQKQIAELLKRISSLEELLKVKNTHILVLKAKKEKQRRMMTRTTIRRIKTTSTVLPNLSIIAHYRKVVTAGLRKNRK